MYKDTVPVGAVQGLVATPVEERGRFARVKQGKRVVVASVQVSSPDVSVGGVMQDAINNCIPAPDEVLHKLPLWSVVDLDKVSVVAGTVRHVGVYVDLRTRSQEVPMTFVRGEFVQIGLAFS